MRLQALFFFVFAGLLLGSCTTTTPSSGNAAATQLPSVQSPAASQQATAYSGLPTSRTAEGYHILGKADAPLTIVHYSDFL